MLKTFIFVRGQKTPLKDQVVAEIMAYLNPDVNRIKAIKLSLGDYCDLTDKSEIKAADRTCKNLAKKIVGGSHQEEYLVIDNESLHSPHWLSYLELGDPYNIQTIGFGVDVYDNFTDPENLEKLNLQEQKLPVFIATMYKYVRVQSNTDIPDVISELKKLVEGK